MRGINPNQILGNYSNLLQILTTINNVYNYENLIIVSDDKYLSSLEFSVFVQRIAVEQMKPVFIFTKSQSTNLKLRIHKNSLSLIFVGKSDINGDDILDIIHKALLGFRTNKSVFILDCDSLEDLVDWLWKEQFINSLILWRNVVYSFDPFPALRIIKPSVDEYFSFKETSAYNLKGYYLDSPVIESLPRLYPVKDNEGNDLLSGPNGYLFNHFIHFMNITWNGFDEQYWQQVFNESGLSSYDTISLFTIQNTSAEIAAESPIIIESSFTFDTSYPTDTVSMCLMIPANNELINYLYILKPFSSDLWILVALLILYTTVLLYYLLNTTYFKGKPVDLFICYQQSFNVLLNASNLIAFRLPRSSWIILYLPLFIFGLGMYSSYTTYLSSFLTTVLFEKDIETIDDLLRGHVKILLIDFQMTDLFEHYNLTDKASNKFVNVSYESYGYVLEQRNRLNTSFGYLVPSDMWKIFQKEQELLRRPIFKLSRICYTTFFASFPIKQDTYIGQPLKYLILLSQQFGLFKAWEGRSFRDALHAKLFHLHRDNTANDYDDLSPSFFALAWWFLFGGLALSCLACMMEMLYKFSIEPKSIREHKKRMPRNTRKGAKNN